MLIGLWWRHHLGQGDVAGVEEVEAEFALHHLAGAVLATFGPPLLGVTILLSEPLHGGQLIGLGFLEGIDEPSFAEVFLGQVLEDGNKILRIKITSVQRNF